MPAGVKTLGSSSFRDVNALTSVTLPQGLERIKDYVFIWCSNLATLNLPSSLITVTGFSIYGIAVTKMTIPEGITRLYYNLAYCPNLTEVSLPSTLTNIDWSSFSSCPALTEVTCKAATPPTIEENGNVFKDTPIASARLKVPASAVSLYENAVKWRNFKKPTVGI